MFFSIGFWVKVFAGINITMSVILESYVCQNRFT
jgi:hypothetical protein